MLLCWIRRPCILFSLSLALIFITSPSAADITIQHTGELIDPSRITVAARQAELGTDVDKIFAYVRDDIRHDSYSGVLRGGNGTLLSEAGNALDKAVLLSELLTKAGHKVRFAHGTLDITKAEVLIRAMFKIKASASAGGSALDPKIKAFLDSLKKDTADQYEMIVKALTEGGFAIPKVSLFSSRNLVEEARDHYWVQYLRGGSWVDLDPSFLDSKVGQKYAEVKETVETLPEKLFHRVVIRVILEEQKGLQRQQRVLLTYQSKASDLSGQSLILMHQKSSWTQPIPMSDLASSIASSLAGALDAITNILGAIGGGGEPKYEDNAKPVLMMGTEYKVGEMFDIVHPENERAGGAGAVKGAATSEWIEFEFHAPDGKIDKTQRTIFDRIGFVARQKGRGEVSQAPLGIEHPLSSIFCLSFYTGALTEQAVVPKTEAVARTEKAPNKQNISATEIFGHLKSINGTVALLSDRLMFPLRVNGQEVLYPATSPRLIISAFRLSPAKATFSIDLRRAQYRPVTLSDTLSEKMFQLQILKGVLDGIIEGNLAAFLFSSNGSTQKDVEPVSYSAGQIFRQTIRAGIKPKLLSGARNEVTPALPEEPTGRITAAAAQGHLVVVPEKLVGLDGKNRTAWWRIDRNSGETIGVTEDGLHAAVEAVVLRQRLTGWYTVYVWGMGQSMVVVIARNQAALEKVLRPIRERGGWIYPGFRG